MKKILKNVWFWIGIIVLILVLSGGGYYFYKNQSKFKTETNNSEEISNNDQATEKTDAGATETVINPNEGGPTPEVNTALSELSNVTLTAYLMTLNTTSADGKTQIPANSIQPYFFPSGSGVFSIQKLVGVNWTDIASNISYPGHGGIAGSYTTTTEDNINYRVIKIENNKAVSVSKIFVVKRADLSDGFKTYN